MEYEELGQQALGGLKTPTASQEAESQEEAVRLAKKKKKWIQKAVKNPGSFTAKAKRRGMTPAAFQRTVLRSPSRYDATTRRQANLRKTLVSKKVKGKRKR